MERPDEPWDDGGRDLEEVIKLTRHKVSKLTVSHFKKQRSGFKRNVENSKLRAVLEPMLSSNPLPPRPHTIKLFILAFFLPKQICDKLVAARGVHGWLHTLKLPIFIDLPILTKLVTAITGVDATHSEVFDKALAEQRDGQRDEALEAHLRRVNDFKEWAIYCQLLLPQYRPLVMFEATNHFTLEYISDIQAKQAWLELGDGWTKALTRFVTGTPKAYAWVRHVESEIGPILWGGLQYAHERELEGRNNPHTSLITFDFDMTGDGGGDTEMQIVLSRSFEMLLTAVMSGTIHVEAIFSPALLKGAQHFPLKFVQHPNGLDIILHVLVGTAEAWKMVQYMYWTAPE